MRHDDGSVHVDTDSLGGKYNLYLQIQAFTFIFSHGAPELLGPGDACTYHFSDQQTEGKEQIYKT